MVSRIPLNRRAMLRGAGAALALPFLEAMLPRTTKAQARTAEPKGSSAQPPRILFCYVPNGVNYDQWMPKGTGPNWALSPTLQVLEEHRAEFTVLSGLGHPNSKGGHFGADTWLTGANLEGTPGKDYQNSISIDQIAADLHGKQTRFPSLELSAGGGTGAAGHSHTLAFDRTGTPIPTEESPQRLFERLFVADDQTSRTKTLKRYAQQTSILDEILGEANALRRRLGKNDQQKLDEYLTSVRHVEDRVDRLRNWIDVPKPTVSLPSFRLDISSNDRHARTAWLDAMLELIFLAFQTDTTRVITFEWAREAGGFGETGEDHHELSHHGGDPDMLSKLAVIDRFYLSRLAKFLQRLKSTNDSDGNLLDNSIVLYGSGMNSGKGGGHSPKDLPLLLAGGRKLGFRHGSHWAFEEDRVPLSNLLLTLLNAVGVERNAFSDSTGTLSQLTS